MPLGVTSSFVSVSNASARDGACDDRGFTTDPGRLRVCTSDVILHETLVPNDSEGKPFGSLEGSTGSAVLGWAGQAQSVADTPVIECSAEGSPSSAVYDIFPMFTADGATEITRGLIVTR